MVMGGSRTAPTLIGLWLACVLAASAQNPRQARQAPANLPDVNPYASAADIAIGRSIYNGRCGHCHGLGGEGGRGAVLSAGRFRYGGSDRDLFITIRSGVPDTEMPGVNIPDMEVWRLVAYVQQLGRQGGSDPITGDAAAGAAVYTRAACAQCHTIGGQGGFLGPDLTDIGDRRAVRHLRQSIVEPSADIALDYRPVTITDARGATTSGIHLNEDEYSIHLRDLAGNLRSFMKSELKGMTLPRQSLMPSYPALGPSDVENLVAYLASLRPARTSPARQPADAAVWTFDRLDNIGGHKTTVLGEPKVIDSPIGKAVEFDGVDDALFIDNHPLAGASAFTWEAIFRPDGGEAQQRWFHLSEQDPVTGADTDSRMLFEIRVVGDEWYLDSHYQSGAAFKTLMNKEARHPLRAWYHVASVYDGKEFSNYVNGVRQGGGEAQLAPHGPGHASVGVRINKVFYFKGAVRLARFTRRALSPAEFLAPPPTKTR
jgi:putative heme-binding domain-containing protein